MGFFKDLTEEEEQEYRQWARDNYKPMTEINGVWHPVVQEECVKINYEYAAGINVEELFGEV